MQNMIEEILKNTQKIKRQPTDKAKWYMNQYSNINEAFKEARFEGKSTLDSIYREGVDINFDVDIPNKLNMFHCSVTAHGACDPYFLELMFKHGRKDLISDGQNVFEMACAYGDTRHVDVFAKKQEKYKWDLFKCMKATIIWRSNISNLHHLCLYYQPSKEQINELWDSACGGFSSDKDMLLYMYQFFECVRITKEKLIDVMPHHFIETLIVLVCVYLGEENKPFMITTDLVQKILQGTNDRMVKLAFLNEKGFEIEYYDNIKMTPETELPKASCRRFYESAY